MKNTIFIKTIIGFIIISLVLVSAITMLSYRIIRSYHLNSLRSYLTDIKRSIEMPIKELVAAGNYQELDSFVKELGAKVSYRVTVIQLDGIVLADSDENPTAMDNHSNRPEVIAARHNIKGESIRYSTSVQSDMLYIAFPMKDSNEELTGILRLSIFIRQIDTLLSSLQRQILNVSLIVLLLAFIIIYIYTYRLTNPIRELTNAVEKVSAGNFNIKVISHSKDDIGSLIRTFNNMAERIRELIEQLTYQKNSLTSIISSMKEGLFLIDKNGKILQANKSLLNIVKNDNIVGKRYWETIKEPELAEFIRELNETRKDITRELTLNKVFYLGSGQLTKNDELLILLHNITEIKTIQQIKKDIVANVSHELRSPLTAIKGFLETLEPEITATGKEYLTIINRNINRLINIVSDLLTLSRLERKDALDLTKLDISGLVSNIAHVFEKKIAEKNLTLRLDLVENLPLIKADEFKIEQMLINLMDNALQYTEKGGITVAVKKDSRFVIISVNDTGSGIAAQEQERIFERFYVVDKSRSRKYGGTGLGLAIVKHIVLLHNGSISLQSKLGEGSTFMISLPII